MDQQFSSDSVDLPCPHCGEDRTDFLVWLDDESETVQCVSCGHMYRPGSSEQDDGQAQ